MKNDIFAGFDKTMQWAGTKLPLPPVIPAVKIVPE